MQAGCWINLFHRIPATQHDNLVIVTSTGTEVMIQKLVRFEDDFIILRGRLSGSTDQNRVLMVPYDQLSYLAFNKPLLEKEIQAIFGNSAGEAEFAQIAKTEATEEPLAEVDELDEEDEAPAPVADTKTRPKPPSKSILLARLRERLAGGDRGTQ